MTTSVRFITGALALGTAALVMAGDTGLLLSRVAAAPVQFGTQTETALVEQFDKNKDKKLDSAERHAALEFVRAQGLNRRGFGGRGMAASGAATPGPKVRAADVKTFPASVGFYDAGTLRTLFFEFEDADWEDQLMAFKQTDIEVPAVLTVDGKRYREVGVQFRGQSSFMMVPEGQKHSLNVTIDAFAKDQDLLGFTSLNLLNAHEDPTFLRSVLFLDVARDYIPAARANFARVVINGESWGIYANVQQVDKTFVRDWFKTKDGTRWKVPGSPGARGGLEYIGDNPAEYKRVFEIKGKDDPKAWAALIKLTRVLNETPPEKLESALAPILNVDGALRFLALDNALVNNDGYWVRASDYNIYLDVSGKFHILPHDTNETFATGTGRGGRGRRGGFGPPPGAPAGPTPGPPNGPPGAGRPGAPGGRGFMMSGGPDLDPLVGLTDQSKPLRSKLLAVPALREKYLGYTKAIASKWLDWNTLGPLVTRYHALIAADVKTDTRKLDTSEAFETGIGELKTFAEKRRAFLLGYAAP